MIALCVKKQSLDVTPENSQQRVTASKDADTNHNKVDVNSSAPEEERNEAIEIENETTEQVEMEKQKEHSEVAGNKQAGENDTTGNDQRQVDDEEVTEASGTTGSGTMTVPGQEMFSGDGYARVRGFSETADRLVAVEEDSGSSGDEEHTDDKDNKTGQEASGTDQSNAVERRGKRHQYTKISTGCPPHPKSTESSDVGSSSSQSNTKTSQAMSDAWSTPQSKKRSQGVSDAPPPAHVVRRLVATSSSKSGERAPAVLPDEPKPPLLMHTSAGNSQGMEVVTESKFESQGDRDPYSKGSKSKGEEDPYSSVDKTASEDNMYSSIEEAQGGADQQPPPPLPPINKLSKSTSVVDKGRKMSRNEPLPLTPDESNTFHEVNLSDVEHVFSSSSIERSIERGRSYTANDVLTSLDNDPPYDKPLSRSKSHKLPGEGKGQPTRDVLELYAKVDITKKKKNQPVDVQQAARPEQSIDELYAKPNKRGKEAIVRRALSAENVATAELAEDGYSCVKKPERPEPNYSEVGPAVRSSMLTRTDRKEVSYESVDILIRAEPSAAPDSGYEKVGQNSDVINASNIPDPGYEKVGQHSDVIKASNAPDPGYDSINDPSKNAKKDNEPNYENVGKVRGDYNENEVNEPVMRKEAEISPSLDPNYDEIDEDFREQIQHYRERSESRDKQEDT
jgi:hypothetical protein